MKPCHDFKFFFPFRNRLIGKRNEASEDEDENFEVEDRKAGLRRGKWELGTLVLMIQTGSTRTVC